MRKMGIRRRLRGGRKLACLISLVFLASAFWDCASSQSEHKNPLRDPLLNNTRESTGYTETSEHLEAPALLSPAEDSLPGETPLVANMWFETDLRQVLMDLSQETEIPIVWDSSVEGLITYEAVDVPLVKVLEDVLFTNGYVYRLRDGTYYVGSASVDSPSFHLLSDTYTVQLANIMAQDAVQLLPEPFKPYVRATKDLNMICVTAPPSIGKRIIQDLKAIDTPGTQIEIEVLVVEFSKTK
ncbi:hypothetical protein KAU04_02785, partial [bacterium]|nr:hypothetical protein [bacterium]